MISQTKNISVLLLDMGLISKLGDENVNKMKRGANSIVGFDLEIEGAKLE
jgi:hypothetical protein